jgi:hypothetical protein
MWEQSAFSICLSLFFISASSWVCHRTSNFYRASILLSNGSIYCVFLSTELDLHRRLSCLSTIAPLSSPHCVLHSLNMPCFPAFISAIFLHIISMCISSSCRIGSFAVLTTVRVHSAEANSKCCTSVFCNFVIQ